MDYVEVEKVCMVEGWRRIKEPESYLETILVAKICTVQVPCTPTVPHVPKTKTVREHS